MADDDNSSEIISQKLPRLETNSEVYILCQENHLDSFATLLQYLKETQSFGDSKVYPIYDRLCEITALRSKGFRS